MIVLPIILTIIIVFLFYQIEYFSSDILFPKDNITYSKIDDRFKYLIHAIDIDPNKITEDDLKKILSRYKYLFPNYIIKNKDTLFHKIDIYNLKYINYHAITYLYFIKPNTHIDKSIYSWVNNLSNILDVPHNKEFIPYNITNFSYNLIDNHESQKSKDIKKIKEINNIEITPVTEYIEPEPFIKRKIKCKNTFEVCTGYDNSIPYYSFPNIYSK